MIYDPDLLTNLAEVAATRPPLPEPLPAEIAGRVAVFDRLLDRADAEPYQVVEETWAPLQAIVVDVYER